MNSLIVTNQSGEIYLTCLDELWYLPTEPPKSNAAVNVISVPHKSTSSPLPCNGKWFNIKDIREECLGLKRSKKRFSTHVKQALAKTFVC